MNIKDLNLDLQSINTIQENSLKIHGKYNLDKSIIWMLEEFGELVSSIRKGHSKDKITGELGDLTAWIFCIANILDIKLSAALMSTYKKEIKRQIDKYGKLKYFDKYSL